jgi:uncharacterized RDD family membrane protein YckC
MKRTQVRFWISSVVALVGLMAGAAMAQTPPANPPPRAVEPQISAEPREQVTPRAEAPPEAAPQRVVGQEVVRFGADYTVDAGETVREVVVISGSVRIDGRVQRDVVVIGGSAKLSETGSVGGDFVVLGGSVTALPGATVDGDLVVVSGTLDSPPGFAPGGEQVVTGPVIAGDWFRAFIPWVSRGLLWGRLIVPDLAWVWGVVGVFLAVYLVLNLVFDWPVRVCLQTLGRKPLTTSLVGLLVLLLAGPASFLLAVTVIGLAIVPFLWAALAAAGLLGSVAVSRWIGDTILRPDLPESRLQAARSLVLGFAVICLAFMVPVLGLVSWASLGILGLGAAALSFADGLRQENPTLAGMPSAQAGGIPDAPGAAAADSVNPAKIAPGGATAPMDLALFPRAAFLARTGAFVLDFLLVAIIYGLLDLDNVGQFFLLLLAYHIVLWAWKGTTVGGIICQLRVVRTDGTALRFTDSLVRGLSSIFSVAVVGLGFLWILKDAERQAWHDKIVGTYVVKVPKNWPLP